MTTIDSLRTEFEHEARTTRRHLERVPDDKLDWRPHPKSFTVRGLASHLVECVGWAGAILGADEFDVNPATYNGYRAASVADLLSAFDAKVGGGQGLLARLNDADLSQPWRLKIASRVRFEKPMAVVLRTSRSATRFITAASCPYICVCSTCPCPVHTVRRPTSRSNQTVSPTKSPLDS